MSKYVYAFDSYRVVLLSGKQTGQAGVADLKGPEGETLPATTLARTLVDIVVRPAYAGGITQVLEAYRGARGKVTGPEIAGILTELDYVYPYHQAVGYLLEKAGFAPDDAGVLKKIGMRFDFYLTHGMKQPRYEESWRLFVPQGF
jgi:hypothetical protein